MEKCLPTGQPSERNSAEGLSRTEGGTAPVARAGRTTVPGISQLRLSLHHLLGNSWLQDKTFPTELHC